MCFVILVGGGGGGREESTGCPLTRVSFRAVICKIYVQ
jgi:hypothetical protein